MHEYVRELQMLLPKRLHAAAWWELWKWVTSRCFARGVQLCQSVSFNSSSTLCLKRMIVLPSRENRNVSILFLQARFPLAFQHVVPKQLYKEKLFSAKIVKCIQHKNSVEKKRTKSSIVFWILYTKILIYSTYFILFFIDTFKRFYYYSC